MGYVIVSIFATDAADAHARMIRKYSWVFGEGARGHVCLVVDHVGGIADVGV